MCVSVWTGNYSAPSITSDKPCDLINPGEDEHTQICAIVIEHVDKRTHSLFSLRDMYSEQIADGKRAVHLINAFSPLALFICLSAFSFWSPHPSPLSSSSPFIKVYGQKNRPTRRDFLLLFRGETLSCKIRFIKQTQTDGRIRQIRSRLTVTHQYA